MNYEIIQITTVWIILSIAYTKKTLEIKFEAYFYIKSSDRQKADKCKAKQVAAQS